MEHKGRAVHHRHSQNNQKLNSITAKIKDFYKHIDDTEGFKFISNRWHYAIKKKRDLFKNWH